MMFIPGPLVGCYTIEPKLLADDRGWFTRTYCKEEFAAIGFTKEWVQHNHTFTKQQGTIRGMHYQEMPFTETKLVRCVAGKVLDVIIDLRTESPTFLKHFTVELSAENRRMIFIPDGFAHGFQTLTDNCELVYCHSNFYNPSAERGLYYADATLKIDWPLDVTSVSERDMTHPLIGDDFKGINL
jgi:dTDP-4-dehydrorhamnose 3,5-epimerase